MKGSKRKIILCNKSEIRVQSIDVSKRIHIPRLFSSYACIGIHVTYTTFAILRLCGRVCWVVRLDVFCLEFRSLKFR